MKFILGFKYALHGIYLATREQRNMKVHIIATLAMTMLGIYLQFNYVEWCIVMILVGTVIGMEIMNTAIEEVVNFIIPEKRVQAGRIKDLAAGAVLVVSIAALLVGVMLILSKIDL